VAWGAAHRQAPETNLVAREVGLGRREQSTNAGSQCGHAWGRWLGAAAAESTVVALARVYESTSGCSTSGRVEVGGFGGGWRGAPSVEETDHNTFFICFCKKIGAQLVAKRQGQ
jgi:hypothetical protein